MPKNSQITWTPEAVSSFNNAKDDLARATLLAYPDPDADYIKLPVPQILQ